MTEVKLTPAAFQRLKREEEVAKRDKLIAGARAGDEEAQRILSERPYHLRVYNDEEIQAVEAESRK
mgnify:CR=1 FL=1